MSISTWHNICNGMRPAVYKSYMAKSQRQRGKREVQEVMNDVDAFCDRVEIVNFADDFIAFCKDEETLVALRRDMKRWAKEMRLHYKTMYVRPIDAQPGKQRQPIIFCGYKFGRGYVHLTQRTKKRYIKSRHKERSMGSYQGIVGVADTKHLRHIVEHHDNQRKTA